MPCYNLGKLHQLIQHDLPYCPRGLYDSREFFRGQEGDPWIGQVRDPMVPPSVGNRAGEMSRHYWANRPFMDPEELHPQTRTFPAGLEFIERNSHASSGYGSWFGKEIFETSIESFRDGE